MRYVFCNQIRNYLRNPVVYLLCVVIIVMLYFDLKPFMTEIPYEGTQKGEYYTSGDYDIQQGYIPLPKKERRKAILRHLNDELNGSYGLTDDQAQDVISKIEEENMKEGEIITFLHNEYSFDIDKNYFNNIRVKRATPKEIKNYVDNKLEKSRITEFFGRKFSDLLGIYTMYIIIVLTLFVFLKDIRKASYEVLASKPVQSKDYVVGKIAGCAVIVLMELFVITAVFSIISNVVYNKELGMSVVDIWKYAITLNFLPTFFLVSLVSLITLIFKNPLPAIPVPIIMTIYSNQGVYDDMGSFVYKVKPLSTLTRFPGLFFETGISQEMWADIMLNQCVLLVLTIVCIYASIRVWGKVRI